MAWPVLDTEVTFRAIVVKFNVPRPIFIVQSENSKSPPMLEDSRSDLHGALSMHQPQAAKSEPTCDCDTALMLQHGFSRTQLSLFSHHCQPAASDLARIRVHLSTTPQTDRQQPKR